MSQAEPSLQILPHPKPTYFTPSRFPITAAHFNLIALTDCIPICELIFIQLWESIHSVVGTGGCS